MYTGMARGEVICALFITLILNYQWLGTQTVIIILMRFSVIWVMVVLGAVSKATGHLTSHPIGFLSSNELERSWQAIKLSVGVSSQSR